ncbi:MAG: hypothetical protein Q8P10_02715, partial [bacterium]|nr:hypothetical protein [bacterium]
GNNFINTPVVFSNDISDNGYGILGQQGFFNKYKIEFDYIARKINLTSQPKKIPSYFPPFLRFS